MIRAALTTAAVISLTAPAAAHHGGGTFDGSKQITQNRDTLVLQYGQLGFLDYSKEGGK